MLGSSFPVKGTFNSQNAVFGAARRDSRGASEAMYE